jgi:hypothetical protein
MKDFSSVLPKQRVTMLPPEKPAQILRQEKRLLLQEQKDSARRLCHATEWMDNCIMLKLAACG